MTDTNATPADSDPATFEAALAELHGITHRLEDGAQGLEESLADFERGVQLLRTCYYLLEAAEQRIELLVGIDELGQPITAPFDATATASQPGQTAGKRRATPGRKSQPEIGFGDGEPGASVTGVPRGDVEPPSGR
jgi:exodeoxyribonuclease VII small subunit